MNDEQRDSIAAWFILVVLGLVTVGMLVVFFTSGCATSHFSPDLTEGQSVGFLRNHHAKKTEVREILNPDGTVAERITTSMEVGTESTTSDILLGANELLGTVVEGASKVKP